MSRSGFDSVPVECCRCGRVLRGWVRSGSSVRYGFHLRRHKAPNGQPCMGHLLTSHRRVPS